MNIIQDDKKPYIQRLKGEIKGLNDEVYDWKMKVEEVKVNWATEYNLLQDDYNKLKKECDFLKREVLLIEEKDEDNYKEIIDLNVFRSNSPE
jgi:hypothetical protein|tara:strand:+ start:1366 stop:1641 length:276 start_codon:yes stop_codon:yes gene_type:complete